MLKRIALLVSIFLIVLSSGCLRHAEPTGPEPSQNESGEIRFADNNVSNESDDDKEVPDSDESTADEDKSKENATEESEEKEPEVDEEQTEDGPVEEEPKDKPEVTEPPPVENETEEEPDSVENESEENVTEEPTVLVIEVIDGDTVDLESGERVRLLGINTAERGQKCYEEATDRLRELVENKQVSLEKGDEDTDLYGRLLRYVFADGKDGDFVNLMLVREGLANIYMLETDSKYVQDFEEAEEMARQERGCLWERSPDCRDCIGISYFRWDAAGNDCHNLNDEFITLRNSCNLSCDMGGWTMKDDGTHIFTFPEFVLGGESTVTIYTGTGEDSNEELYWKSSGGGCNAIWNNDGDRVFLRDAQGSLVLYYSYD